ncbi:hypothetical protein QJS10_CPA05g01205 [Acorus calamus]|uniref:Uncharacterized protein n=1 Tax=Acorus calamus TaxID=4465 RepID=A0AAV9EYM0_ACOCL|nr:hypothetical protein QJS10_CPA05g01205 [Acorus calamus]
MHNKMLTSPSNKEVCSRSNGRVVGIDSIEKQHHGAAKRMFAHALGLPPSKGDNGGGVLKCNEASKVSNSFGR